MVAGQDIMRRAAILVQDEEHTRWKLPELATWINEGQNAVVLAKPSACSGTVVLQLVRGTRQMLSDPAHLSLLDITRNLLGDGSDRSLSGRVIRAAKRELIDSQEPYWHDNAHVRFKREVRQFIFDEQSPREYFVYPGNDASGRVEGLVAKAPTPVVASADPDDIASYAGPIGLPEPYDGPLVDYVVSRCYAKDDVTGNGGLASAHYQAFASAIGIKIQVEGATSPNARRVK